MEAQWETFGGRNRLMTVGKNNVDGRRLRWMTFIAELQNCRSWKKSGPLYGRDSIEVLFAKNPLIFITLLYYSAYVRLTYHTVSTLGCVNMFMCFPCYGPSWCKQIKTNNWLIELTVLYLYLSSASSRGSTTAEKLRDQVLGPNTGALAPSARPNAALGVGCGRGRPLPLCESGGITPGKFLKTQMLNPAFRWLLAVKFLAFWKLRPRSWGDQYIVGPPT